MQPGLQASAGFVLAYQVRLQERDLNAARLEAQLADYFAKLHAGGKVHLVSDTLADLARRLDPTHFMRVHRSAIDNLQRVHELRLDYQNRHIIVLSNGERVSLSRSRREALETALAGKSTAT